MSAADRRSAAASAWRHLYSTREWRQLKKAQLQRQPLCEMEHGARVEPATVVNHRIPHKGDRALFFDPANLQSLCKPHHDGPIQRTERRGVSTQVDARGYPVDPLHLAYAKHRR